MFSYPLEAEDALKGFNFPCPLFRHLFFSHPAGFCFEMAEKAPVEPKAHGDEPPSYPEETLKEAGNVEIQSLTPEEDKRILRRIDL